MSLSRSRGFTLVELLVVMTIIAVAMGLVGGLAVNGYTKYQAKAEVMTVERLIEQANIRSFATEQSLTLELTQNAIELRSEQGTLFSQTFEYLQLPGDSIVFNSKGIPSKASISVRVSGKLRRMSLLTGN